ncbi:MAG: nitroreductase [Salinarimonas sp.]|nr:nitroreductase [Salinarimonas sp.]
MSDQQTPESEIHFTGESPETLTLLKTRRSTGARLLGEPGPDRAQLEDMLTIAARVPDHGKLAPWRFVVIAGEARARLGDEAAAIIKTDTPDADEGQVEKARNILLRAPVVVAVVSSARSHPKIPEWEQVLSAGAACQNLILAATAMGFRANWITEWIAFDRRFLEKLGLAADERIAGFVHIGSSDAVRSLRARPDLGEIVTWL